MNGISDDNQPFEPPNQRPNILCVDDISANLLALEALLADVGANLFMVPSGKNALEEVRKREFAAILLDVMMPDMDGYETAKRIRECENAKQVPIIFVTANPPDQMQVFKGYALGAVDYIHKPIPPEILQSKVRVFLELYRQKKLIKEQTVHELEHQFKEERLRSALEREKETSELSASFRLFVESVKDYAIFLIDTETRLMTWNPGVKRILGYEKEEFQGLPFSSIFTPGDIEAKIPEREIRLATTQGRAEDTRWHVRKDGKLFWADGVVVPLRENGELKGFAKLLRDRTDSKLAEMALLESEERLRLSTESTNLGTWDLNPVNRELICSERMMTLCGFLPGSQVSYDVFLSSIHPEDRKRVGAATERALSATDEGNYHVEYRTVGIEDHVERWLSVRGKVLFDGTGRAIRMLGTAWDVSNRKRTEEELRRSNEDLERFAHIASHDLQEPLRMVTTHLQLLAKRLPENVDDDCSNYLSSAREAAARMKSLIRDLLEYSRIGTKQVKTEVVDCQEILSDVRANLRVAIDESGGRVTSDSLPRVRGDYLQLTQIFQNLIGNAIKFRSPEPLTVQVGCTRKDNEWLFWVKDNGSGMEQEHTKQIFEPFHRLHAEEKIEGSGLGLAVCKRAIERHGGQIWVESGLGKGSTFFFTIPFAPKIPVPDPDNRSSTSA